ncbi:hypothetical protein PR048_029855 [Dryococelus australis]|uniref:Peptidase S1 domain-containing protein n=1 Tax=Dryococelus australis TaxID=614101 RepID=A0ABQ9G7A9_9NEOP|nr:hypothetical protein PR048_029855 [Dryococelus australis]
MAAYTDGYDRTLANFNSGRKLFGGYRIVPKPCQSRSGEQGICMFNYECTQRGGEVVSACVDGFLFGSCCRLRDGAALQQPDVDLEGADTHRPPIDDVLQHAEAPTSPPRPLPQADTVLLHHNGSVVTDSNNPEDVFRPPATHLAGSHGAGETVLLQPAVELSTGGVSLSQWHPDPSDDSRLETVSLVAKPFKTSSTTDGKHTTFYALDTSKNPFPLGTTLSRPPIPDATEVNEIDDDEMSTKEASSPGPIYYSSRWPSSRPSPGKKPLLITKHSEKHSTPSYFTTHFSYSDDGMVPVPVITFDSDHKRRPPLHEPEPLPEPEPYPESHSESINHILSILNDTNLGVFNPAIQPFSSTQRPNGNPGISTWGLIDGLPSHSWRPHETLWSSSTPPLSTSSYTGSHSTNATFLFTSQHSPGPSTTSTSYLSEHMQPVTGLEYTKKPNMTQNPMYSKPAPTVIVLQNIASDYTTHWPSSHYPSSADKYQAMGVTKKPLTTPHLEEYSDENTKRPTVHISSTINMYRPSETTKRPTVLITATKRPTYHTATNPVMFDTTTMNEKPTDNHQSMYETSTVTRKPTVHISSGVDNYHSSTSSYRPTVFITTTSGDPQSSTFIDKKPPSSTTSQSTTLSNRPNLVFTTGATSYISTSNTKIPTFMSTSTSTSSAWTDSTMANTKPLSVNYITIRPDSLSSRPITLSQQSKPSATKSPQDLPTTLNYNDDDIVYSTSIADLVNFPPVRNPQLNMSIISQQENPWVVQSTDDTPGLPDIVLDNEVSTPPFEEDDRLNIKLHSFVSKIVNSLQENFLELEDVVLKTGANFSTTIGSPPSSRPGTTTRRPIKVTTSRRPVTGALVSTTKKPLRLSTSARPPATSSRRPATVQRPRPTANQVTSARPTRPILSTTRRPKPSRRPSTPLSPQSTTTRRPRPRPTTRSTTTTSTTTGQQQVSTRPTPTRRTTTRRTTTTSTTAGQQQVSTRPIPTRRTTTRRTTTRRTTTTTTTTPFTTTEETTLMTDPATTSTIAAPTTSARPVDYKRGESFICPLALHGSSVSKVDISRTIDVLYEAEGLKANDQVDAMLVGQVHLNNVECGDCATKMNGYAMNRPPGFVQSSHTAPSKTWCERVVGANGQAVAECGVRPLMKKHGRIVGGKGATFGAWPWQVLVKESTWLGLFTKNKCGGVLITARFVITAAHCQPGFLANLVAVLGEFDISGELESKRSVTKNVKRVIVHRNYDAATFANDLALLELETPVPFDTHIVPICMPRNSEDFTGRMATVTGWGRLKYGSTVILKSHFSTHLQVHVFQQWRKIVLEKIAILAIVQSCRSSNSPNQLAACYARLR